MDPQLNNKKSATYKDSGVSIKEADDAINSIKSLAKETYRKEVLSDIGGYNALFKLDIKKYKNPVLVSGTDGVGTKVKIAIEYNKFDTIGIDLVAMCVNDIILSGAEPLFFLDYIAVEKVKKEQITEIIIGIKDGCKQAGMSLIGGEIAEMPGVYANKGYDLAGFVVGVVEMDNIIDNSKIKEGDILLGLPSSGFHSNGFSLIRHILFDRHEYNLNEIVPEFHNLKQLKDKTLGDILLTPTYIYYNAINKLINSVEVKGFAHITGGGHFGNISRILPSHLDIKLLDWEWNDLFKWIQKLGNVTDEHMKDVFNLGIGMVLVISPENKKKVLEIFDHDIKNEIVGNIIDVGSVISKGSI